MTTLTGTFRLLRLDLRRDRIRLPIWILALAISSTLVAGSFAGLYVTEEDRQQVAATMDSPAGLAMTGPARYLDDYHFGAMMGHQMLAYTALLAGIMSVMAVVRHTRTEEESGRAELIRAGVVGRHAHLTAALGVALLANLVLAVAMAAFLVPLGVEGIGWSGSLLYGFAHAAVGLAFAGVAAITAQVTEHPRAAMGMGLAAVGVAYLLRALGDTAGGELSWLSPIGWAQATYVYLDNRWWPLLLGVGAFTLLAWSAFALSTRRDVGAGLRRPRPGRGAASRWLLRPSGFALRLHRGLLIAFVIAMAVLGASYGSVLSDVEEMLAGMGALEDALAEVGGATLVESFLSFVTMVLAVITAVYVVLAVFKARSEEGARRAEPVLATGLSRERWFASHLMVSLLGGAMVMVAAGLGLGLTGAAATGDDSLVGEMLGASLAYVPALWVAAGVAAALIGLLPRWAHLAWIIPVYGFVVGYLGQVLQFPDWLRNLSPFGHVPQLPADSMAWGPVLALTGVALFLLGVGVSAFRRRDLMSTA